MSEKKSKKIFEEDLSVFQNLPKQEEEVKKPVRKKNPRTAQTKELESLIKNLQALGFKITPPSSEEDRERQESSLEKLGFSEVKSKKKVEKETPSTEIKFYLGACHVVSNQVFGPGEVILPSSETELARSLLHQDQLCRTAYLDTSEYQPISRSFIIQPGKSTDKDNKYRKIEVSAAQLSYELDERNLGSAGISVGNFDVAGYNPQFNSENVTF